MNMSIMSSGGFIPVQVASSCFLSYIMLTNPHRELELPLFQTLSLNGVDGLRSAVFLMPLW